MSAFWSAWVTVITLAVIIGCTWLLLATRKSEKFKETTENTLGHEFDGIEEYDNPLPQWWFYMFVATVIFGLGYLLLYPGLGNFKGLLGWTSHGQWEEEMQHAEEVYAPVFAKYAALSIEELQKPENEGGLKMGQRMFANNCSVCHGAAGTGAVGFPNLTDNDWLYGGEPATIKHTITQGRNGGMPAWADALGEDGVRDMASYVMTLSGKTAMPGTDIAQAERQYQALCAMCHGQEGLGSIGTSDALLTKANALDAEGKAEEANRKRNEAKSIRSFGAPNLTDDTWLYGGNFNQIAHTIRIGRFGVMPAHKDLLSDDKIHLITAYVYSLSNK
ncbi:cytochrome-c oxidase, cbb3-type subunit III [Marinobacterium iners]|uniref:Cbb3-type cytochrome c oxidase subunit n=1 Tax=Marinobacterium iners DSM 11526 TaxID=1122198 RepID=A0A1H3ZPY1_9GAMM|nr:cytochrome-c oxidase, cbb3-type subunit III [Marinobacterium iners]SEA25665.1 cytochrome c oxidase cbb3-type subunit 3 [Marinobacterium iners DSM 11526]